MADGAPRLDSAVLETPEDPIVRPGVGANSPRSWLTWTWRQLTSMRIALLLLLLLAVAAVPGSLWPQRPQDPAAVLMFAETNPGPMKSVMDLIGVDAPELLAPLVPPAPDLQQALRAELGRQLARTF